MQPERAALPQPLGQMVPTAEQQGAISYYTLYSSAVHASGGSLLNAVRCLELDGVKVWLCMQ